MGNKTLVRLLAALVVVGLLALVVKMTNTGNVDRSSKKEEIDRQYVLDGLRPSDIAKVRMTTALEEMNFFREEGEWRLAERDNFPADGEAISKLALTASKLKVMQQPTISASNYGSIQLLDPGSKGSNPENAATIVTFIGEDGKEKGQLWIGKAYEIDTGRQGMSGSSTQDAGRYVRSGADETVFLVEETFADLETEPAGWLDDEFFKVTQVKSITRTSDEPAEDWVLERKDPAGDFAFANAKPEEKLDSGKVSPMKNAFASPRFEDIMVGEAATPAPDKTTFVVTTFEGFTYTVKVSEKSPAGEVRLSVDVEGKFDQKRKPGPEETEEEAKKLDEKFATDLKQLEDKLANEKKLAGRVFVSRSFVIDSIDKKRSEILVGADDAAGGAPPSGGPPGGMQLPGGIQIPGLGGQ